MEGVGEGGSEGVGSVKRGVMGSKGGDHLVLYEDNVGVEGGEGVREWGSEGGREWGSGGVGDGGSGGGREWGSG